jgi:1-acyl-sn-glycerol-3-phosphate acyltransferase
MDPAAPRVSELRRVIRLIVVTFVILLTLLARPAAMRLLPWRWLAWLLRFWTGWCLALLGIRVTITGPGESEHAGGELLVANHISWLDGVIIPLARHGRLVIKDEDTDWPSILRRPMQRTGVIFLDRARPMRLPGTIAELTRLLGAGHRVIAFPEATSYCGRHQGVFHPALFQCAVNAGAAVQPVRIRYRRPHGALAAEAAFIGDDGFIASLARIAGLRGLTAEVLILPRIPFAAANTRTALARQAENMVLAGAHGGNDAALS